ncbi:MAG: hypothetical protein RLZZ232_521 [Planctomycetota bacterium]|jgi:hypothetical protein
MSLPRKITPTAIIAHPQAVGVFRAPQDIHSEFGGMMFSELTPCERMSF